MQGTSYSELAAVGICECEQIKKILEQVWKKQEADSCSGKVLVLVRHADQFPVLMELLQKQGFSPQTLGGSPIMQSQSRCESITCLLLHTCI